MSSPSSTARAGKSQSARPRADLKKRILVIISSPDACLPWMGGIVTTHLPLPASSRSTAKTVRKERLNQRVQIVELYAITGTSARGKYKITYISDHSRRSLYEHHVKMKIKVRTGQSSSICSPKKIDEDPNKSYFDYAKTVTPSAQRRPSGSPRNTSADPVGIRPDWRARDVRNGGPGGSFPACPRL